MSTDACCACLKVMYQTKQVESGQTTGWWECVLCGNRFVSARFAEAMHKERLREREDYWRGEVLHAQKHDVAWEIGNIRGSLLEAEKQRDEACAQVAALREALKNRVACCRNHGCTTRVWRELGESPCGSCESDAKAIASTIKAAAEHDARVRREALEEAAKEFDECWECNRWPAEKIRALASRGKK